MFAVLLLRGRSCKCWSHSRRRAWTGNWRSLDNRSLCRNGCRGHARLCYHRNKPCRCDCNRMPLNISCFCWGRRRESCLFRDLQCVDCYVALLLLMLQERMQRQCIAY